MFKNLIYNWSSAMQVDLNKKISQATKWSGVTEIIAKLISPIVNMVLARLLTPEAFGVVATITMVISFAEVFTDAGFQKYIIQHEFKNEEELNQSTNVAFWTNFFFSALICVIIFIFRSPIAVMVGSPGLGNSISLASVLIIIAAFSSIQMARYKRAFDFKTLFYVRIGAALIPLVVTIPLAFLFRNYWALLFGNFASQLFTAILLTVKSKWKPSFYFSIRLLKEMFSFSAWTLLESISIWLTNYIDVFIVGYYLNEYYLGIYKTSMSTVGSYMAIVSGAITPVLFSALSRYQNDEAGFRNVYYRLQRITAVLIFPMGVGIFLFRDLVTNILLGSQWGEASGFIGLWGLTSAFTIAFSYFSSEVYRSKGNPKISLFSQILHLLFIIPTLLISIHYDFEVLYTARSLVRIQGILNSLLVMRLLYKFKITDTFKNVLPMIVSACIMGGIGYGLQQISTQMIWQFFVVFLCVIVYFAVLLACFPKIRTEIMNTSYVQKFLRKMKNRNTDEQ